MDQERFDDITKKLFDGTSRRRVLGGALASALGAGVASVAGIGAKGKKGKGRNKKGSKGKKGRGGAEFTCTAANANDPGAGGCQDPDACCASTPAGSNPICITFGTQASGTQQFCGDLNDGSGVCRTCPPGTVCSLDGDNQLRCVCTSSTCPNGCCIDNDQDDLDDECITPNGFGQPVNSVNPDFDGAFVCGTGGSVCNVCSLGTLFSGCCSSTGACVAGTSAAQCGSNGEICEDCRTLGPDATCSSQTCVGGTTTTTSTTSTTTSTTTTLAPCGLTKKGKQKVRCGNTTICCPPGRGCKADNSGCRKKKN